jgi:hypothetical protein
MIAQAVQVLLAVIADLLPIALVLAAFQGMVLRRPLRRPARVAVGLCMLVAGLALVLYALDAVVFPLGREVADTLAAAAIRAPTAGVAQLYLFLGVLGFAAALAEPVLTAVAHRAAQLSGGAIRPWGLRVAVASGIGLGACLGLLRMRLGVPLFPLLALLFFVLYLQARATPRLVINLALDSGVVTISTVTAPLLVAVGLGVANRLEGGGVTDGFGLLAVTAVGPALTVMGYAQLAAWRARRGGTS